MLDQILYASINGQMLVCYPSFITAQQYIYLYTHKQSTMTQIESGSVMCFGCRVCVVDIYDKYSFQINIDLEIYRYRDPNPGVYG